MTLIFIGMKPMEKKLVVRITDQQAKWLCKTLEGENTTKSQAVRAALNQYLIEKTRLDEIIGKK